MSAIKTVNHESATTAAAAATVRMIHRARRRAGCEARP